MENKKGQVTVFIIIGIVIVFVVIAFFAISLSSKKIDKISLPTEELDAVKKTVNSCLANSSESAITELKLFGGNLNKTNILEDIRNYRISPISKEEIENNAKSKILYNLGTCLVRSSKKLNFSVDFDQPDVRVTITDNGANVYLKMQAVVNNEESSAIISEYDYRANTEILKLSNFASIISKPPYYDGKTYCITCLKEFINNNSVAVTFFSQNNTDLALLTLIKRETNKTEEFLVRV